MGAQLPHILHMQPGQQLISVFELLFPLSVTTVKMRLWVGR